MSYQILSKFPQLFNLIPLSTTCLAFWV